MALLHYRISKSREQERLLPAQWVHATLDPVDHRWVTVLTSDAAPRVYHVAPELERRAVHCVPGSPGKPFRNVCVSIRAGARSWVTKEQRLRIVAIARYDYIG